MSDTPRTDAEVLEASSYYQSLYPSVNGRNQPVHADFARELERENARLREALERIASLQTDPSLPFHIAKRALEETKP